MPVHDWFRVDANVFHHFHQRWTIAICDTLNAGLLPRGYSALVEQHAGGLVPDVLALQQANAVLAARANRIVIRHRLGEIVCVLEIVSPGNKSSRAAFRAFGASGEAFLVLQTERSLSCKLPVPHVAQ